MITADKARRNAEMSYSVVAKNPLFNAPVREVSILFDRNPNKVVEDVVLTNIYEEICNRSYCGGRKAKIRVKLRTDISVDFTKISSRLKENGFDSIYGGNDKEVKMLVER